MYLESAKVVYYRGNDLQPATEIVMKNVEESMVQILDINDSVAHKRYVDQIQFQEPDEFAPILAVISNNNEYILYRADTR
ncbi:unnamed protein product [Schistosoma curassoni]|uniref:DPPIV_N domain-containing protein n=1 Tax=Schistosoma curassoni TaxID=6186 RepID=A0A183KBG9_9TREM|nr:unnamed protein product [Schistosoma curassoni]